MFSDFYKTSATELSAVIILLNLALSLTLALFVVWVYRRTHRGLSYSTSLLFTLLMIALLGTTVVMVVQQNIVGAFALLGAFALIRFRTIVKDTRDVAFVFYALSVGVAVGTGAYATAMIATLFVGAVVILATRYHVGLGAPSLKNFILTFHETSPTGNVGEYDLLLESLSHSYALLSVKGAGDLKEYSYLLHLKEEGNADRIVEHLRKKAHIKNVTAISAQEAWER